MQNPTSRLTKIGDWLFEVKMVRALKASHFGDPYASVAMLTVNGEHAYIDTQMSRQDAEFNRKDFMTFYQFCQQLELKQVHYDKISQGIRIPRVVDIAPAGPQRATIHRIR
ncbi:hypothetical protein [Alteromonas sp. CYL-A6]|uniref:hypothetical protein n=1 Tax=Alteromonas nitratireducens TaxID=3390813 RepID=UPI0034BCF386